MPPCVSPRPRHVALFGEIFGEKGKIKRKRGKRGGVADMSYRRLAAEEPAREFFLPSDGLHFCAQPAQSGAPVLDGAESRPSCLQLREAGATALIAAPRDEPGTCARGDHGELEPGRPALAAARGDGLAARGGLAARQPHQRNLVRARFQRP